MQKLLITILLIIFSLQNAHANIIRDSEIEEVIAIPLYPHYAMSSYETAVEHAKAAFAKKKYPFKLNFIKPFYNEFHYIQAMADNMKDSARTCRQ